MLSASAYEKLKEAVKKQVGESAFSYVFPGIEKALEKGDGKVREEILIDWLDVDFCRVCSVCGKIMEKGWYNMGEYACSDACVMKQDGIDKKEFKKFQIYKATIQGYLDDFADEGGYPEDADKLTKKQIEEIMDEVLDQCDAYYTEWN